MNGTKIVVEIIETQIKSIPLHMGLQEHIRFELQTNIVKCAKCIAFGTSSFTLFHGIFLNPFHNTLHSFMSMLCEAGAGQCMQPPGMRLLLLLVVIFVVVLLTLQLKGGPDAGSLHLVSHTKPIKCTINGSLDSSEDDLPLGGGGGGRRNKGTARGRRRNKGRGRGAVGKSDGGDGRSGDGESNHFLCCLWFLAGIRYNRRRFFEL